MELQVQTTTTPDKMFIYVLCAGLSREDIAISFDKKEGILEIQGKPKESEMSKILDLEIEGKVTVTPKFRANSNKVEATVENGVLLVTLGLAEDVNVISIKGND